MSIQSNLDIVLLVAGRGSRLGTDAPKCLAVIGRDGETILDRQLAGLSGVAPLPPIAVVGYRHELIRARHPGLRFVRNDRYADTNTAKSLLCALEGIRDRDVLWLNGDVVFDPAVVPQVLASPHSCMAVNRARCADEEIKYVTDGTGRIVRVSKQVVGGEGEAVGINRITARDLHLFRRCLGACADRDYFERGLELAIEQGLSLYPVDIGDLPCIEIDFPEDLERAKQMFGPESREANGLPARGRVPVR